MKTLTGDLLKETLDKIADWYDKGDDYDTIAAKLAEGGVFLGGMEGDWSTRDGWFVQHPEIKTSYLSPGVEPPVPEEGGSVQSIPWLYLEEQTARSLAGQVGGVPVQVRVTLEYPS